jgi:xanthine dehydrogenase YagS FAD-binding subunit
MGGQGCYSVHASDLAPPLIALGAQVSIVGSSGVRDVPLEQFFSGPEQDVRRENVLAVDEVLTAVTLPPTLPGWQGTYLKGRERTAGDFPIVSVAVGFALDAGRIQQACLVLGGVAPIPGRNPAGEAVLEGQVPSPELAARAAAAALAKAQPLLHNAFKVEIGQALVERAIMSVTSSLQGR